jgi:hypothetical protein
LLRLTTPLQRPGRRVIGLLVALPLLAAVAAAAFVASPAAAQGCTDTFTTAGGGDWNTGTNWSTGAVPGGGDIACIPATVTGQVTIATTDANGFGDLVGGIEALGAGGLAIENGTLPTGGPSSGALTIEDNTATWTIHDLTLSGGTLNPNSQPPPSPGLAAAPAIVVDLTGSSSWTGGVMSGGYGASGYVDSQVVVTPGASLAVSGSAASTPQQFPGTLLVNQGALNWTAGDFCAGGDGVENASGGTFTMSSSNSSLGLYAGCSDVSGVSDAVVNDAGGTIVRSGGSGSTETINLPAGLTNNGALRVSTLLVVDGNYQSTSTSVYTPVLAGTGPAGTGFGQVSATVQVAGSPGRVAPVTVGGFLPANGESFIVLACGTSCGGGFPSPGNGYTIQNNPTDITAVAVAGLAITPGPINFGTQIVGAGTGPLTETLVSQGSAALTISAVGESGPDSADFVISSDTCQPAAGTGGVMLRPGAACAVNITFFPQGTGPRSTKLDFTDDAAGSPQTAALTGAGTTTPASVVPPPSPSPTPSRGASPSPKPSPKASPKATPSASPSPGPTATSTARSTPSPTPTATAIAPPPPRRDPPAFTALSVKGLPYGPPGTGLDTSVQHYPAGCSTVYFFFGGVRIGSAPVDASGHAVQTGLSVPGSSTPGQHTIASSCQPSGKAVVLSASFRVTTGVHRAAFDTSLNDPGHINLTVAGMALSAAAAAVLLVLLAFPAQIFNATLQDHYEEVRGWFHLRRPLSEVVKDVNQRLLFPIFLVGGGALFALITPDFGFNRSTLALVLGLGIAVAVVTVGFAGPSFVYFLRTYRDRGQILVMPGSVVVAGGCVLVSRLLHFEPGYLYGLLAIFVFHHETDKKTDGKLAAVSALLVMVLALAVWFARIPLTGLDQRNPSFLALVGEAALGGAFVIGVESVLVGLLPMNFLDGSRIKAWNSYAWAGLFLLGLFTAVEVLIQPGTGYVGHTSAAGRFTVLSLYLVFCAISFGFWAYFRFRTKAEAHEEELDTEGDYGVR